MDGKIILLNRKTGRGFIEYNGTFVIEFYTKNARSKLYTFELVSFVIDEIEGKLRATDINKILTERIKVKRY